MRLLSFVSIIAISSVLTACGGEETTLSTTPEVVAANSAPTVSAGDAQTVDEGSTVQLGAAASDADGDTITLEWSQSSGPTVTLSSTTDTGPSFIAPDVDADTDIVLSVSASDGTDIATSEVTITVQNAQTPIQTSAWIVNTTGELSKQIMDGGTFVEVDVLSVTQSDEFVSIETNAIPGYEIEVTQPILDWYNDYQPGAYSGGTTLALGNIIDFGEDVGLTSNCDAGGNGWWPGGGGACADSEQNAIVDIPLNPTEATEECATGAGPVGLWVNGVYIYNWTDTFSYNNEGVWNHYAVPFRSKGMDVCLGHAGGGQGQYHHHSYNECLRQEVSDEGTGHSPIYGYAGDGYAIHGPYQAENVLAQSCWIKRDYSAGSATGCGVNGERSCQFVDPLDISQGLQDVAVAPTTSDTVGIDYDTDVAAVSGFYLEDYYYDSSCTAQGDEYLDQYNGHEDEENGYHYHTSVDENMLPTFPLSPAIQFRGDAGGSFTCSTGDAGGGPGGGMPPPPGG